MIGGGGRDCQRADHGIGITATNEASFLDREGTENKILATRRGLAKQSLRPLFEPVGELVM